MDCSKKIKIPLIVTVFFVLITFTLPPTIFAGPPVKCPCFSKSDIMNYVRKGNPSNLACSHNAVYNGYIYFRTVHDTTNRYYYNVELYTWRSDEGHTYSPNPYEVDYNWTKYDRNNVIKSYGNCDSTDQTDAIACYDIVYDICTDYDLWDN